MYGMILLEFFYVSLIVHFIVDSWVLHSYLVDYSKIHGKHTGQVLSQFLLAATRKYGIFKKVVMISVNNASNTIAQIRLTAEEEAILVDVCVEQEILVPFLFRKLTMKLTWHPMIPIQMDWLK